MQIVMRPAIIFVAKADMGTIGNILEINYDRTVIKSVVSFCCAGPLCRRYQRRSSGRCCAKTQI